MDLSIASETIDYLFSSTYAGSQAKLDSLSGTVLGQGIDLFEAENYQQAVQTFKRAAGLSPSSENALNAYDYMGQAYLKLEDTQNAIKTYQEAIRLFPTEDSLYVALGDIYLKEDMIEEATKMYENAVSINPNDAESQYSLGQAYLSSDELDKAGQRFREVIRISPANAAGYYGLGQVARAEGDKNAAVSWLIRAQGVDKDFELAYRELGYAYADMGDFEKAGEQQFILETNLSGYATDVENYIAQVTPPEINLVESSGGFDPSWGRGTKVSYLDSSLSEANKTKLFSLTFSFSKEMDKYSVINAKNWMISRATLRSNGGVYNYGLPLPSTEVNVAYTPAFVTYDENDEAAVVYFQISQNADANGTIDPEHLVFKFSGVDAYGKSMDAAHDEYAGFSGVA